MTQLNVEEIKLLAHEQLLRFVRNIGDPEVFRPDPDDYAKVFVPDVAERARAAYEVIWLAPPRPEPKPGQSDVLVFAAPASLLTDDNELSRRFPNGYRTIAALLDPHRIWLSWKFVTPGSGTGMAYDGLVWLDGRFAWFPKPWRVLGDRGEN
jgi:hypothetical protein